MRAVLQRVRSAHVDVASEGEREGERVGAIAHGLLVYLGVGQGDVDADGDALVRKIVGARVFVNDAGKVDRSVVDVGGSVLVVSQFTLFGDLSKGKRPSFEKAMEPVEAARLYEAFVEKARAFVPVETGRFRASMRVASVNDGPMTLWLDTRA
jgi:D-tyrosyl-tRNA(Tyr) deacylase